jgi:hypothetical protein
MRYVCLLIVFLCVWTPGAVLCKAAQEGSLPKDPADLFALARDKNGLESSDVQPWHIRGRYTIYKDGKPEDQGVYEEWWVSPTGYKRSFTGQKFSQTEYANGSGLFRDGTQEWAVDGLIMRMSLLGPVPQLPQGVFRLEEHAESKGGITLACVSLANPPRANPANLKMFFPKYCFDRAVPLLRIVSNGSGGTVYNHIVSLQGRYVAREVRQAIGGEAEFRSFARCCRGDRSRGHVSHYPCGRKAG